MRLIQPLLRIFFSLLYHQFAWSYNLVAATVSLGRWKSWVQTALPYLGGRVLELGFGPGHLQRSMLEKGIAAFGVDESRQMARQAGRRLRNKGFSPNLSRALAQKLPFPSNCFDTVAATFPSEYIFDPRTLIEIRRVLTQGGRLVILPMAWITGRKLPERVAAWLFRVTGEAPGEAKSLSPQTSRLFTRAGFQVRSELVELAGSRVLVVVAVKTSKEP